MSETYDLLMRRQDEANKASPFEADKDFYVPASPPPDWLRVAKKLTGVSGPDAGVLWAAFITFLQPAKGI